MLTTNELRQIAFQIRVLFDDNELQAATDAVNASLAQHEAFLQVPTDNVEPFFFGNAKRNVFRDDVPGQSLDMSQTMQNAPKHDADCFLFPAVLG